MNKVILIGRLTKDPDVRYGQGANATAVAKITLAVDRRFRRDGDDQTADFIGCTAFGKQAEFIEKYAHKGTKFVVEGRIQTGRYTNKDGQTVFTTDVVIENIEFAESKNASSGTGYSSASAQFSSASTPAPEGSAGDGFMNIPNGIDEELPFA